MAIDLTTDYGGLTLKNPIVMGASNIVTDADNLVKLEQAGVGAIVYKSLFEEQIQLESYQLIRFRRPTATGMRNTFLFSFRPSCRSG